MNAFWTRMKGLAKAQQGSVIVLASLVLVALLSISALVIDGGSLYIARSRLQSAADAAALSGAQELTDSKQIVNQIVQQTLSDNHQAASLVDTDVQMNDRITVHLKTTVPLTFARIFGYAQADVRADATAIMQPMGQAIGAAPLGIDGSIPLEYGQTYSLKVDQTGEQYGDFGVLALGGPGAATYEDNLIQGYQAELKVGDILDTQTGNIAGKTRNGVQTRINESPYPAGPPYRRDDSRILLIPVYKPYHQTGNQLKTVKVTGFAYFYITAPMDAKDTSIHGVFIRRTGRGHYKSGALDRGAYAIRLYQ